MYMGIGTFSYDIFFDSVSENIYILYGFPCEMDFSHRESPNPARIACDEDFTWKTIQNAFYRMLYTLRHCKVEMDLSHNCSQHGGKSEVCIC